MDKNNKTNVLYDIHQIEQVLFAYATACDYRDWDLLKKVFDRDKLVRKEGAWKIVERYMHIIRELGTRDVLGPG